VNKKSTWHPKTGHTGAGGESDGLTRCLATLTVFSPPQPRERELFFLNTQTPAPADAGVCPSQAVMDTTWEMGADVVVGAVVDTASCNCDGSK
jgi:hypothetical protein